MERRKVGIIGAGISGLLVYFPDRQQVLHYIQSYAHHFDLIKHIKFHTRVLGINYEGMSSEEEIKAWSLWGGTGEPFSNEGKWTMSVEDTDTHVNKDYQVDFVILCIGRLSDLANIPEFPPQKGTEVFKGEVLHLHSGKYVAMGHEEAAKFHPWKTSRRSWISEVLFEHCGTENPCTLLYKTEHWNMPDYFPWGIPLGFLYLNRFSGLLVHKPGEGFLLSLPCRLLSPLRWGISKFVESDIRLPLAKYGMIPMRSFLAELSSCQTSSLPRDFYDGVEKGSIRLQKSHGLLGFCKEGIIIDKEEEGENNEETSGSTKLSLEADVVILATGFNGEKKLKNIFVSPIFQNYIAVSPSDSLPLYRKCVHPRIPQLAIIGFSESIANLYTSEMHCRWVAELVNGTFRLPEIKVMEKDVASWDQCPKKYSGGKYYSRSCVLLSTYMVQYNDKLCKDMGLYHWRKRGFFAELFHPYGSSDYAFA